MRPRPIGSPRLRRVTGVLLVLAGSRVAGAAEFTRDVLPLFRRACVRCHGAEHASGGLRLDGSAGLGASVTPGRSGDSPLYRRLLGLGGETRMPRDAPALAPGESELVRRWIDEGAAGRPVAEHWAYRAPVRPELPAVRRRGWVRTPIDQLVLAALERRGHRPAPPADRETLVRRVTLDLTGLPPTLSEIDRFLADRRPDAYERVVDRLLASPHFGERWAVPWLDAARYADSNGYQKDDRRTQWPYRDWVVAALNDDMPFDRFTVEQLAGDLLPAPGTAQRIATGFHRNTMSNEEGGVDPDEARWDRLVDRAATTATVWLGTTLGCAQCHDHKHDPFTQKDFYRLLAYFENAREATLPLSAPPQAARLQALAAERGALEARLDGWTPALGEEQRRWEDELRGRQARWRPLTPRTAWSSGGATLTPLDDGSVLVGGARPAPDLHTCEVEGDLRGATAVRLEALPDPRLPRGGPGRASDGNFLLGGIALEVAEPGGAFAAVPLGRVIADDRPRIEPELYSEENLLRPDGQHGWGVWAVEDDGPRLPRQLLLIPRDPLAGSRLRVRLRYPEQAAGESIGRFRLSVTRDARPEASVALSPRMLAVALKPDGQRTRLERDQLAQAHRRLAPSLAADRARLAALDQEVSRLAPTAVLVMKPGAGPARTRLRRGGSFASGGEEVASGPPERLAGAAAPAPGSDRLALARWLVAPDNPLTARVVVNRIWAGHFGRGLVDTPEDFGTAGARPSHPELLDWLATELVRGGWRQKRLHRLIVTSATYRQAASDDAGRFLAPLRLDAEMVRDVALAASGLLHEQVGGPPVFPPQPDGVWALPGSTDTVWPESHGRDRHRRAIYTFWRRTAPYPSAQLFDAGSREVCRVARPRTSTPLQALVTLNDPAFWEAALALARRMVATARPPRLSTGFRLCTGRRPSPAELTTLTELFQRRRAAQGQRAALALVANVLLNLDETLTRN
jgi:hypothetical protein